VQQLLRRLMLPGILKRAKATFWLMLNLFRISNEKVDTSSHWSRFRGPDKSLTKCCKNKLWLRTLSGEAGEIIRRASQTVCPSAARVSCARHLVQELLRTLRLMPPAMLKRSETIFWFILKKIQAVFYLAEHSFQSWGFDLPPLSSPVETPGHAGLALPHHIQDQYWNPLLVGCPMGCPIDYPRGYHMPWDRVCDFIIMNEFQGKLVEESMCFA
jgi:hypothetical protein